MQSVHGERENIRTVSDDVMRHIPTPLQVTLGATEYVEWCVGIGATGVQIFSRCPFRCFPVVRESAPMTPI